MAAAAEKTKPPATDEAAPPAPPQSPKPTAAAAPSPRVQALTQDRWQLAEHIVAVHAAMIPEGVPYEEILKREFWAHVASRFKPGETIQVRPDDGAYAAELFIWAAGPNWADVSEVWKIERPSFSALGETDDYRVEYRGPVKKWRIVRLSDRAEIKDGFATTDDAHAYMRDYKKVLKR